MELPIDHFRLLGVSPSAKAEAVLRAFQLRLDRTPDQGFTQEVLLQRAELLRLSADLLTDALLREDYENALLGGASGLELSSNREVAGLILLWEADSPLEAFTLARKALQPPQAPALGSSREADLALVAALSCQSASQHSQEQRHYQSAALLLQEGIQLLQRMGKLPNERQMLEQELENLLPYRILDLLSRDIGDQESHQEGLQLLDAFVLQRGGLEGGEGPELIGGVEQSDFVLFFHQIRKFLTVQEQLDLFKNWQKRGSIDAGFLGVIVLVAAGFSQRKPERLQQARKSLKSLELPELDKYPLLGCIALLLADVKQAEDYFSRSLDEGLKNWLESYQGEPLAALCDYCRGWLRRDVLPGYRDIDIEPVDLEAWFADRDVQAYVENLERKGALGLAKSSFSFLSSLSSEGPQQDFDIDEMEFKTNLPMPGGLPAVEKETNNSSSKRTYTFINGGFKNLFKSFFSNRQSSLISSLVVFALLAIGSSLGVLNLRNKSLMETSISKQELIEDSTESKSILDSSFIVKEVVPLTVKEPSEGQIQTLLQKWLNGKAKVLSGGKDRDLYIVAREALVKRVELERAKDKLREESQNIKANIISFKLVSQTPKRIEVKVKIEYNDQRIKSSGEIVSETSIPSLKVTYVLGREKELWQLVDYISGG